MRPLLIISLLSFSFGLYAQSFFKKYTVDTSRTERKYNIHLVEGIIYSTTYHLSGEGLNPYSELVIDQLDINNGDMISRIKFPRENSFTNNKSVVFNSLIYGIGWQSNPGGFNAKNVGVYKISDDKELQFFIEIGDTTRREIPRDITVCDNGEIIVGSSRLFESGASYTAKGVVTKISSQGDFIWEYIDDISSAKIEMRSVITDDADNIYVLSTQDGFQDSVRLTKLNPDGSKQWIRTFQEGFQSKAQQILNLQNGNLLVAGYAFYDKYGGASSNFYMEIDTSGNPIWVNDYKPYIGGVANESEIKILEDGRIARVYDGYGYPTLMINYPDGEVDFIKHYDGLDVRFPDDLLQLDDGSFMIVGWINPNLNTEGYTSWLMRTDIEGNFVTSISELMDYERGLILYPNPTSSILYLEFDKNFYDHMVIYDLFGNIIKNYKSGNYIDVSDLDRGIYILTLSDNLGNLTSRKFVKQ